MQPPSEPTFVSLPAANAATSGAAEDLLSGLRYAIDNEVARGGMGAILSARQRALQRSVAMKVMLTDSADALRFVEEAQVTGQLEHPNIVPVHELGRDERGQLFYTMKFVRGITLKKVLSLLADRVEATVKKYPLPALLTIFQKACDAIAFAHSRGVLHRDLKPENIMIGDFGEVLVMDWGLAKIIGLADRPGAVASSRMAEGPAGSTMAGTIMGTPTYMSPEQARGEVEALDERSDVYALGAILYEILALRPAVSGRNVQEVLVKVIGGEVARLPKAGHHDSLVAVVHKAMALDRADRYLSVAALQEDVAAYQGGFATSAEGAGFARQLFLAVMRHKAIAAAAVIALFTGLGFGGKAVFEGRRADVALDSLKAAIPTFIEQARLLVAQQRFDEAITKLDFALTLDPHAVEVLRLRANYLQAALRLNEAVETYRRLLALQSDDTARANLALCEKLLGEHSDAPLPESALDELWTAIIAQKRDAEALPLATRLAKSKENLLPMIRSRLAVWSGVPGWKDEGGDRAYVKDGLVHLRLGRLPLADLEPLRGLPIDHLDLGVSPATDFRPLAGMRLRWLWAVGTKTTDLSPLAGMPLEYINLDDTADLDLTPLHDSPLKAVSMVNSRISDIAPLRNCPLETFAAVGTQIRSVEPLRGCPLKDVRLTDCMNLTDITPLKDCTLLEAISLPKTARDIEFLRQIPTIKKLCLSGPPIPPAEFWAEYDAQPVYHVRAVLSRAKILIGDDKIHTKPQWGLIVDLNKTAPDLHLLRGLPIDGLHISDTSVADLGPLRGMPLKLLTFSKTEVTDVSPLLDIATLEAVHASRTITNIEILRRHPRLKYLSWEDGDWDKDQHRPNRTVAEFWGEYDAQQAAGKK